MVSGTGNSGLVFTPAAALIGEILSGAEHNTDRAAPPLQLLHTGTVVAS